MTHSTSMGESTLPPLTPGPHRKRIGLISIVACLGGLLFGYDTGVANGAEGPMQVELGLSDLQLGVVISSLVFAAAIGALIGGKISDAIGRRTTIIVLAVLFFLGVLVVVFSPGFGLLVAGRIILGLAVGGASTVVPVYLAELAPFEIRGSITGRNELAIVVGQFAAFVVNYMLFATVFSNRWLRRIVFVGIGVSVTQQLTGINSIMYYGSRVLEESGFSETAATLANTLFGLAAVVGGIIALYNMDRIDRRKTFFIGLTLTTTCHCLVGIASLILPEGSPIRPYVILILITAFVLSMQTFLNIAVWVWLAEIFPLQIRGLAIGIAVFFGWFINGLLALYVPTLLAALGMGTFFLFAIIGVIMLGFLWHEVPETRNRSLESLEEDLLDGSIYQSLPRRLPFAGVLYDRR